MVANAKVKQKAKLNWEELLFVLTGVDPRNCPVCGQGKMITHEIIDANRKAYIKDLILLKRIVDILTFTGKLAIESP